MFSASILSQVHPMVTRAGGPMVTDGAGMGTPSTITQWRGSGGWQGIISGLEVTHHCVSFFLSFIFFFFLNKRPEK